MTRQNKFVPDPHRPSSGVIKLLGYGHSLIAASRYFARGNRVARAIVAVNPAIATHHRLQFTPISETRTPHKRYVGYDTDALPQDGHAIGDYRGIAGRGGPVQGRQAMARQCQLTNNRFRLAVWRWLAALGLMLASVSMWVPAARAADQATIKITSVVADGSTPLPFARFQIIDSNGELITTRETTPPDGTVSIDIDLTNPEMTYTVTMETPPACALQPDDQVVGPFEAGDSVDLTFETSFEDDCDLGSVSVYSYTCPDGLDVTIDDYARYRDNCVEANNGEQFELGDNNGGQTFDLTTGAYGIDGRAPLVGLIPGEYFVRQEGAEQDRMLVFCLTYDGAPLEASEPADISRQRSGENGKVVLTLKERGRIACDFFTTAGALPGNDSNSGDDQPADDAPDQGDVSAAVDNASIEFHVATCPAGYDGGDYFGDCAANGTDDVAFNVTGQNTGHTDSATSNVPVSPGFGIAVIDNLPADTYTMSEEIPGDTVSLWVYCADSPGGGSRIPTPENGSQEFDIELAEGQAVICDWFVTPDQQFEPAIIRLTRFACEPAYGGNTFAEFTGDCTDPAPDVTFNLSNGSGVDINKTTNDDGKIRYTELAPGNDYLLTEDVPSRDARQNRVAYCAVNGGDYVEYEAIDGGEIDLDPIAEGDQVQCLWYAVPVDQNVGNGSVRIHKSECPAGTTSNYFATCYEDVVGGIGFELDGPGSVNDLGNTGEDGLLTFGELPGGKYVISEIAPADYSVAIYVVNCSRDGASFPFTYDDSTGLRITFDLPAGGNVVCDWYNIPKGRPAPTPTPGGGSITVITRLCPENLAEIKDFGDECDMYGAGAEFQLTTLDTGARQTAKSGSDSRVVFNGLANGAYALKESSGDWCKAQADSVDAGGNVLVQNGANTNVYIYNCGKRNVHTLPATGAGLGRGTPDSSIPVKGWAIALMAAVGVTFLSIKPTLARSRR